MQATSDMIKIFKPPDEEALAWKACVINISNVRMIVCLDFQSDIKQHKDSSMFRRPYYPCLNCMG